MTDAPPPVTNEHIAALLERVAAELEEQRANSYRVDAYRAAARVVRDHRSVRNLVRDAGKLQFDDGDDASAREAAAGRAQNGRDRAAPAQQPLSADDGAASEPTAGAADACSVQELALADGREGLDLLPRIGSSLAAAIEEIARTGRLRLLDRLEGHESPSDRLTQVPGIGPKLAKRIERELHVDTLDGLLAAARDGRLQALEGFGPRRVEAIRTIVETLIARRPPRTRGRSSERATVAADSRATTADATTAAPALDPTPAQPSVALLLELDRRYRALADADELPKIAPTRNNPEHTTWLPVLHTDADGWSVTALFSNTDRAHELARTRDWVVLYYVRADHEDQCTVVTEVQGKLAGRRVVRGRESECAAFYAAGGESRAG